MREFKYGVGVIAPNFLLNLLLVKMSQKSSTKPDFWGKNQKDMSDNGTYTRVGDLGKIDKLFLGVPVKGHAYLGRHVCQRRG